ncbi:hypothetical protein DW669_11925 [Lachnospiraceae bacterium AM25-17]|nr:hypothetical protein DW669_11925 [Lachnospiraceae bacterium AM25-17]RJU63935.1 hypothetical protein DW709_13425 [Coprococcus sp. AM27-12LB]
MALSSQKQKENSVMKSQTFLLKKGIEKKRDDKIVRLPFWVYNKKEIPVWFINKEKRTLFTGIDRIEMEGRFK